MQDAKHTQGAYNAMMAGLHCLHLEADAAVANDIHAWCGKALPLYLQNGMCSGRHLKTHIPILMMRPCACTSDTSFSKPRQRNAD